MLRWLLGTGCGLDADCVRGGTRSEGMPSQLPGLSTTDARQGRPSSQPAGALGLGLDAWPAAVRTIGRWEGLPGPDTPTDASPLGTAALAPDRSAGASLRCSLVENLVNWAQIVGSVLALVAVTLASVQLMRAERFNRQSREDLREDRRIDFLLSQLIDIAVAVEPGALNSADVPVIRAKIRALPWDMLPVLRAHVDVWPTDSGREQYAALMRAGQERGTLDPGGSIYPAVVQELEDAVDQLLEREQARR